jgi:hypothetical protein
VIASNCISDLAVLWVVWDGGRVPTGVVGGTGPVNTNDNHIVDSHHEKMLNSDSPPIDDALLYFCIGWGVLCLLVAVGCYWFMPSFAENQLHHEVCVSGMKEMEETAAIAVENQENQVPLDTKQQEKQTFRTKLALSWQCAKKCFNASVYGEHRVSILLMQLYLCLAYPALWYPQSYSFKYYRLIFGDTSSVIDEHGNSENGNNSENVHRSVSGNNPSHRSPQHSPHHSPPHSPSSSTSDSTDNPTSFPQTLVSLQPIIQGTFGTVIWIFAGGLLDKIGVVEGLKYATLLVAISIPFSIAQSFSCQLIYQFFMVFYSQLYILALLMLKFCLDFVDGSLLGTFLGGQTFVMPAVAAIIQAWGGVERFLGSDGYEDGSKYHAGADSPDYAHINDAAKLSGNDDDKANAAVVESEKQDRIETDQDIQQHIRRYQIVYVAFGLISIIPASILY